MSSLNIFQTFVDEQVHRPKMNLSNPLTAILDYLEYLIRMEFNINDKTSLSKKKRKTQIVKQHRQALIALSREEKIYYYCTTMRFLGNFITQNFEPPKSSFTGTINAIGFARSFNIKRWKEKKLRFDLDKHLLYAERQTKIKSYDFKNYILRRSKNKDYHSFVLEAINNAPHEKSMTVHIGFTDQAKLNEWLGALRFSVDYRQWEFYYHMFQTSGQQHKNMGGRTLSIDEIPNTKLIKSFQTEGEKHMMSTSMVVGSSKQEKEAEEKYFVTDVVLSSDIRGSEFTESEDMKPKEKAFIIKNHQEKEKLEGEIKVYEETKVGKAKTFVGELMDEDVFEEPDVFEDRMEEESQELRENKKDLDLFHKLHPTYELEELEIFANFELVHDTPHFKIYQHTILEKRIKLLALFDRKKHSKEQILSMISKPETSHLFNDNIESALLKTFIPSENSALMYQINKPYNRLYRSRDFVFIRHVFSLGEAVYMIDKSVENTNYPPFMTIVRGELCNVYGLFERNDRIELMVDFELNNEGMLNPVQHTNLTLKYIKGFATMIQTKLEVSEYKFFQLNWDISKNKANEIDNNIRTRRNTIVNLEKLEEKEMRTLQKTNFRKKSFSAIQAAQGNSSGGVANIQPEMNDDSSNNSSPMKKRNQQSSEMGSPSPVREVDSPSKKVAIKRFNEETMEQVGQLKGEQSRERQVSCLTIVNQLTPEGLVVIRNNYRTHHYITQPLKQCQRKIIPSINGQHPIWKDEWAHTGPEGGLTFIHKKKIEDQKGVLKFILSKLAKNIVSGQSVTNISLPVDIFSVESNLERFLFSMNYAPIVLEGLEKASVVNRLIKTFVFGLTNSIMYLSMEKPFNPIVGETYQCWLNGCPAYAEQISHHPPIAALMIKGRGYDVTSQVESKINLGVNSGTGFNEGIYRVKFHDGMEICFMTPGGEISGLATGDRKFNLSGKSYYWIASRNIVIEVTFDPFKKGVFSFGKQEKPSDFFEGIIWQVKPEFMAKFVAGKRKEPDDKDKVANLGKLSGCWNKFVFFNGEEVFSFDSQFPVIMEYEKHPLPSDANWREDIEFRRRNQIPRAQTQKQRLEVIQRKDKKLREKYMKKKK